MRRKQKVKWSSAQKHVNTDSVLTQLIVLQHDLREAVGEGGLFWDSEGRLLLLAALNKDSETG